MPEPDIEPLTGGISVTNKNYQQISDCSSRTATRDLRDMIDKKILKSSKLKGVGAFYELITTITPQ